MHLRKSADFLQKERSAYEKLGGTEGQKLGMHLTLWNCLWSQSEMTIFITELNMNVYSVKIPWEYQ